MSQEKDETQIIELLHELLYVNYRLLSVQAKSNSPLSAGFSNPEKHFVLERLEHHRSQLRPEALQKMLEEEQQQRDEWARDAEYRRRYEIEEAKRVLREQGG